MSVIIKLLSKFDDSGLRKAKSGFGGLKSTLGAIGIGMGLKQIADGLLDAAKAASIDQKSQQLLNNQLTRNAGATKEQVKQNNKFIDTLAMQVGIADDELRPAQARLARATGSTAKSQTLLKLALDASTVSGKPLESVSTALAKAFNGNTTSLKKMFPELSKSKDIIGDLTETVKGAAAEQADPFQKMNIAFGELQEKLGSIILPYVEQFIDDMMKPGGAIDQVGKFLDDVSNPKTEAGKTFASIKDTADSLYGTITSLGTLIVELFAMKAGDGGILGDFKSFLDLVTAIADKIIEAADSIDKVMGTGKYAPKVAKDAKGKPVVQQPGILEQVGGELFRGLTPLANIGNLYQNRSQFEKFLDPKFYVPSFLIPQGKPAAVTNNITVNAPNVDGKAVIDAAVKYAKTNGGLPASMFTRPRG